MKNKICRVKPILGNSYGLIVGEHPQGYDVEIKFPLGSIVKYYPASEVKILFH